MSIVIRKIRTLATLIMAAKMARVYQMCLSAKNQNIAQMRTNQCAMVISYAFPVKTRMVTAVISQGNLSARLIKKGPTSVWSVRHLRIVTAKTRTSNKLFIIVRGITFAVSFLFTIPF